MRKTEFDEAFMRFEEAGSTIMDRFRLSRLEDARRPTGAESQPCPGQTSWGNLKRESYGLIKSTLREERGPAIIRKMVADCKRDPAFLYFKGNEFHFGILAIDQDRFQLDKKQIHSLALQFKYARQHQVEPRHLVGFLYQSGNPKLLPGKLKSGYFEPGFKPEAW